MRKLLSMALAAAYLIASAPDGHAAFRVDWGPAPGMNDVIKAKAKKRRNTSYRWAHPRNGDQLIGRVRPNRRQQADDAAAALAILGIVGLGVGAALAGRGNLPMGSGSGCGIDYTHKNPMGCGGYMPTPAGSNNPPGPYRCKGAGGWYVTNTFRAGCYSVSMDRPGSRLSDSLR